MNAIENWQNKTEEHASEGKKDKRRFCRKKLMKNTCIYHYEEKLTNLDRKPCIEYNTVERFHKMNRPAGE